ncbi:MAG: SGNH/GDSL hydrolase family protein [Bacteroidia bacterium]
MMNFGGRFLALGDSYTIGEGLDELERWPNNLTELLNQSGISINELQIIATTGWTTSELYEAIERENPQGEFDLVSLLIGVNNQYRGLSTSDYAEEFSELLSMSVKLAANISSRVLVLSIPDWGMTPFAESKNREEISKALDSFNQINKQVSLKQGVNYCDITPISREKFSKEYLAEDKLHYSGKMYSIWAKMAFDMLMKAEVFK